MKDKDYLIYNYVLKSERKKLGHFIIHSLLMTGDFNHDCRYFYDCMEKFGLKDDAILVEVRITDAAFESLKSEEL